MPDKIQRCRVEPFDELVPLIVKGYTGHTDYMACSCARDFKCIIIGTLLKLNRYKSVS